MRPHPRMAETDASAPRAWATCEKCGFVGNLYKFIWQHEWRGVRLINTRHIVCEWCLDQPQRQLGSIFLPPDPVGIVNARPEAYYIDEHQYRYQQDGTIRLQLDGTSRLESNLQDTTIGTTSPPATPMAFSSGFSSGFG